MLSMCVCMHYRFVENHPIWILEDGPLISKVVLSHRQTPLLLPQPHGEPADRSRALPMPRMLKPPVSRRTSGRLPATITIRRDCFLVYELSCNAISSSITAP
jgi:hypothetical protein